MNYEQISQTVIDNLNFEIEHRKFNNTDFCNTRIVVVKRDVVIEFFKQHNV